jgi:nicotinate-nucleotide pyrophosphorylase (carboxylating)
LGISNSFNSSALNPKPETYTPFELELIDQLLSLALREDLGDGDHSSLACIPSNTPQKARLLVKEAGIISGIDIARKVAAAVDPSLKMEVRIHDGASIQPGDIAFYLEGPAVSILSAERLMLNIMQRMSGIATHTHRLVKRIEGTHARLLDTRKTGPGMRVLEKRAVLHGGGFNHRMGLYDMIMIKDNHADYAGGVEHAIDRVHAYLKDLGKPLPIEVEARTLDEVQRICSKGGIQRIMLDNFSPNAIREALKIIQNRFETEASGGIREHNLREYAETGVDFISVGALTHQVQSLDLSLKAC